MMIFDTLGNADRHITLHRRFAMAFEFPRKQDLASLSVGTYKVEGKQVYAMISEVTDAASTDTFDIDRGEKSVSTSGGCFCYLIAIRSRAAGAAPGKEISV